MIILTLLISLLHDILK
uniref:Uncharacterized protein n=1 Tax=Anguilla anguilla TaxID=7936 RepID=A0A0E9W5U8_ANGAN